MKCSYQSFLMPLILALLMPACSSLDVDVDEERGMAQATIESFDEVITASTELAQRFGEENVLIVLDIDNTLLTSAVDLGGDIWYQWQRSNLALKPRASQKVQCLFEDTIGLLYELSPMNIIDARVPEVISRWQDDGFTLFALTSRAPKYRAATERELSRHGISFVSRALAPMGQKAPVYRATTQRELSYMKGVMMTSGMNKGAMLEYILGATGRHFDGIIFVDDSQKNIDAMAETFENRKDVDMRIFHYTKVEDERKADFGAVLTQQQADNMDRDWRQLSASLNSIFPQRKLTEGCLSVN